MTIDEIRRRNLLRLLDDRFNGVKRQLAIAIERDAGLLGRYLHKDPAARKDIGSQFARHIENKLGLPTGWLDKHHESDIWDRASELFAEHFDEIALRPIVRWADVVRHCDGEKVKEIGVFSMPAGVSKRAFFCQLASSNIEELAHQGELIAVDPAKQPAPGEYVLASVAGTPHAPYRFYPTNEGASFVIEGGDPLRVADGNFTIHGTILFALRGMPSIA